ncbi:MAG: TetR/AcrR family transcriptional regulator [Proteobacteria bacterium]|nr:TetR/AcrR family transcriptional regulator [Pseudomonadota bacterium]
MPRVTPAARTAPSKRSSEKDASTRELILQTALEAFSLQGFDGASTRSIAAQAGVNQGLIPYYFKTKQTLWREAVDRAFDELHSAMSGLLASEGPSDREAVARMIRVYVAFVASHPEFVRLMNEEGKRTGPRMRWLVDRHVRPLVDGLTTLFSRMADEIGMPKGIDPTHLNYIFVGSVAMIFHQAPECRRVSGVDPLEARAVKAHADALVHIFLGDSTLGR